MNGPLYPSLRAIGASAAAVGLTSLAAAAHDQPGETISDEPVASRAAAAPPLKARTLSSRSASATAKPRAVPRAGR